MAHPGHPEGPAVVQFVFLASREILLTFIIIKIHIRVIGSNQLSTSSISLREITSVDRARE